MVPRWKLDWKMKTLIGTGLVVNGLYVWALVSDHKANKAAEKQAQQKAAATPPGSAPPSPSSAGNTSPQNYGFPVYPQSEVSQLTHGTHWQQSTDSLTDATQQTYGNPPTSYSTQQTSTGQSTNPPSANNGPNSRREERPLARKFRRRSPVDIPSELHLKSRIDAVDDGIVTTAGI